VLVEGEGSVRMSRKKYTVKKFDIVVLTAGEPYQLCNTGKGRLLLLGRRELGRQW